MRPQLRVNAIGTDHHVGFGRRAVRESDPRAVPILPEVDRAMAGVDDPVAANSSMKSARCMPKHAFHPAASVTCTGAIGAPS